MIATIPLVTGNKLNCFISARGMLAIIRHCGLVFFYVFYLFFFLHVHKSSSQKQNKKKQLHNILCTNFNY